METRIEINGIEIDVAWKRIRHIHLRVYPPDGRVGISAPRRMSTNAIRDFATSKSDWITKHRHRIMTRKHAPTLEFVTGENHYLWGQSYVLKVIEKAASPAVDITNNEMILQVHSRNNSTSTRGAALDAWYRQHTREALPDLLAKWESRMNVRVKKVHVQKMKTRWGSCNTRTHQIRFNSELAKKPPECLEYVVVHELVHLLEPSHNHRFYALMDQYLPEWKTFRDLLNRFPDRHKGWDY